MNNYNKQWSLTLHGITIDSTMKSKPVSDLFRELHLERITQLYTIPNSNFINWNATYVAPLTRTYTTSSTNGND